MFLTRLREARPWKTRSQERPGRAWQQNANTARPCLWSVYLKLDVLKDPVCVDLIVFLLVRALLFIIVIKMGLWSQSSTLWVTLGW